MTDQNKNNDSVPAPGSPFNEVSVLFPLLSIYTASYLALTAADFFLQAALVLPAGIMPLYVALLGAYATDKEIRRWVGQPEPARKGTVFVYLWLLMFLTFYIGQSFRPEYAVPPHLLPVCLQVLGIFFGSKTSKYLFASKSARAEASASRERMVLELIRANGRTTRQAVEQELAISTATAGRLLAAMERTGRIIKKGAGKDTHYVAAGHNSEG